VDSHDYDADIRAMALEGKTAGSVYEALSQRDVQSAADALLAMEPGSWGPKGADWRNPGPVEGGE
jgi:hypothetical protein